MLLGYGGRNFYSFKEDFDISLMHKKEILKVLGIKGANASGKTNAIKALSYITNFISDSFSQFKIEDKMLVHSFFDSEENIELYIHFKIDNIEYRYEMVFNTEMLISEKFFRKEKKWTTLLTIKEQKIIECIRELNELKKIKINRDNVSIVSLSHQYGLKELNVFYNFAKNLSCNIGLLGKYTNDEHFLDYSNTSKFYYEHREILDKVIKFLKRADTGITDIKINKNIDDITGKTTYIPFFCHVSSGKSNYLHYLVESNGTKLLYRQLAPYFIALEEGSVIAMDEFDIGLHPDLSLMIIELFDSEKINKNGAQLIISSHYSEIMDRLGKYRLIFVNKEENESYLYRLDEIKGDILRPDRSILPAYNSRKIGGRPRLVVNG